MSQFPFVRHIKIRRRQALAKQMPFSDHCPGIAPGVFMACCSITLRVVKWLMLSLAVVFGMI